MSDAACRLAELIRAESGIRLASSQLESVTRLACRLTGMDDVDAVVRELERPGGDRRLLQRILDSSTVNETFFFRHPEELHGIDWHGVLAAARARGASIARVWSAACASGEEAYTLAMLAAEALGTSSPPVSVLGTDLSESALAQAREGRYGPRSVRHVPADLLDRHLVREGDLYRTRPALRALVDFRRHNLAGDAAPPVPGPFDLVLCRNVLIYLEPAAVAFAVGTLGRALAPTGRLILGASDRLSTREKAEAAIRDPAPAPPPPPRVAAPTVERALRLADEGALADAASMAEGLLRADPMNVVARFVAATARLACGEPAVAVGHLRSALYADPGFGLAAFQLGRAYDALDDAPAAERAYRQALRSLDAADERTSMLLRQVDLGDVAAACRARLADLRPTLSER